MQHFVLLALGGESGSGRGAAGDELAGRDPVAHETRTFRAAIGDIDPASLGQQDPRLRAACRRRCWPTSTTAPPAGGGGRTGARGHQADPGRVLETTIG